MASKRDWQSLSDSYRDRLSRSGISEARYNAGDSVTAARGHGTTPERPERALKNPERYAEYVRRTVRAEDPRRLARETKAIGLRNGVPDILDFVKPHMRADYIAGWQIAHSQFVSGGKKSTGNNYARMRMDELLDEIPEAPDGLAFYH